MKEFRLSKYNPDLRDARGRYQQEEWTSVGEIGRSFNGLAFGVSDYRKMEDAYVEAVRIFMRSAGTEAFIVQGLEQKYLFNILPENLKLEAIEWSRRIADGKEVSGQQVDYVVRLNLRDIIWCRLVGENGSFVHFGDDFYMYIGSKQFYGDMKMPSLVYLEDFRSPYHEEDE